jgi:hypothetical protein
MDAPFAKNTKDAAPGKSDDEITPRVGYPPLFTADVVSGASGERLRIRDASSTKTGSERGSHLSIAESPRLRLPEEEHVAQPRYELPVWQ